MTLIDLRYMVLSFRMVPSIASSMVLSMLGRQDLLLLGSSIPQQRMASTMSIGVMWKEWVEEPSGISAALEKEEAHLKRDSRRDPHLSPFL